MDYESLELELQDKLEAFKQKWKAKTDDYNGNFRKMYRENWTEMQADMYDVWEICTSLSIARRVTDFATVEDIDKILEDNADA